jgi:hypothetical protein
MTHNFTVGSTLREHSLSRVAPEASAGPAEILIVIFRAGPDIQVAFCCFSPTCRAQVTMAQNDSTRTPQKEDGTAGFRIANGPVVYRAEDEQNGTVSDFAQLPRIYGAPILFAIPRDPRTLFTYWNIDWESFFAKAEPVDRQVYLRVLKTDGAAESESVIEPMLGSYYALVAKPSGAYRVELGYYRPASAWHSVAISDAAIMPPESASENLDVDVATVPFHLSFQRMIDMFRTSNGDSITTILSRLQGRALTEEEREMLSPEEWEILRAMNLSLSEVETVRRTFSDRADADRLRKRTEAILGFGSTSPPGGFGGSSWGSVAS